MRILVISNMYPSPSSPAFGIFVKNQVEGLQAEGMDLTVAAIRDPRTEKWNVLKKYLRWVTHSLLRFTRNYDLVHAHYAFPSGWLARLHYRIRKVPYIVTVHGGDLNKMAQKGSFFKKQTKRILEDAAHVITVGPDLYKEVTSKYNIPEERVSLLNMGVDRSIFYPRINERNPFQTNRQQKHLLFVGNLIKEKGIEELLSAVARMYYDGQNVRLHLVGAPKSNDYEQKLHEFVQTLGLEECVQFHGPKSQDDVARYMTYADLFILPSHIEGFGLVALESMACGTPVVASRTGGLPFLLSGGAGTLAEPQNIDSLTSAIDEVLSNSEVQKCQINAGFGKAESFDARSIIQEVVNLYHRAVEEKSTQ
ncbi:glycosyltransferase involved in cell wall biosynthesis [Geomicrobium halophilum]|uniref:Glycosyltransferase involved in cell wall biosynthesis n=1 Tax=Geomicrobium halophilum TaxID=549000 RepID=A0A841PNP0_9BACL|nr:glycosyltransferase [Geomicrobium halophilum]MBB6450390.1 glycosyltransferase involved in cell wall biosynthesis [Geomicrobium halophilum]